MLKPLPISLTKYTRKGHYVYPLQLIIMVKYWKHLKMPFKKLTHVMNIANYLDIELDIIYAIIA